MNARKSLRRVIVPIVAAVVLLFAGCTGAQAQSIKGMLQAADGKEIVVTLDDGTTVRLSVQNAEQAAKANQLVGEMVEVKFRADKMVEAKKAGENQLLGGVIESMGADTWVIGGRTVQVKPSTRLDGGLMVGVVARAEVVKMADGSLVATEIETDNEDEELSGKVESISANRVTIGGKTFQIGAGTMLDKGLAPGVTARVEFVSMPDGTLQAIEVETEQDDFHFQGAIESMGANSFVIGGKMFKVNAATVLDKGLSQGVVARVEFIQMADGSLVAREIETDRVEMERRGREAEGEGPRGADDGGVSGREAEARGREAEGEAPRGADSGGEVEARGREAEGEAPSGGDDSAGSGGSSGDDSGGSGGSGSGSSGSGSGSSG